MRGLRNFMEEVCGRLDEPYMWYKKVEKVEKKMTKEKKLSVVDMLKRDINLEMKKQVKEAKDALEFYFKQMINDPQIIITTHPSVHCYAIEGRQKVMTTYCSILYPEHWNYSGAQVVSEKVVRLEGFAFCDPRDHYNKGVGEFLAFSRALDGNYIAEKIVNTLTDKNVSDQELQEAFNVLKSTNMLMNGVKKIISPK